MRTKKSLINIMTTFGCYFITLVLGFITRSCFLRTLGDEFLGINSLFTNIISVMSIAELGIGTAITYNLYKPISEKNELEVRSLMKYYKYVYRCIAVIIFVIGFIVMPFIPKIVGETTVITNLYILFFLYVFDTSSSYLLTYKRSIFYADQRNYIVTIIHGIIYLIITVLQIFLLYAFHNVVLYIIVQIILHMTENVIISVLAEREYPYIKELKNAEPLKQSVKANIVQKVNGLIYHQIGSAIVLGTDNIIISMTKTLGVISVGYYSNYTIIINNLNTLIGQIFSSVTASVGNLMISEDENKSYSVYKRILWLNALLANFVGTSVLCLMEPFISIWLGEGRILNRSVLFTLVVNFYIQLMKRTCGIFKNAAGVFYEDRLVPIAEAIINLMMSIIFVKLFGLAGVCMGTITSSLVHYIYDFPKYVYGLVLKKRINQYIRDYSGYFISFGIIVFVTYFISTLLCGVNYLFLRIFLNILLCIILPNILFFAIWGRKEECKYWLELYKHHFTIFLKNK